MTVRGEATNGQQSRRPWISAVFTLVILGTLLLPGTAVPSVGIDHIDLVAHVCLFGAWGAAVAWEFPRLIMWRVVAAGALLAIGTELAQLLAVARSFDVVDICADIVGVTIGAVAARAVVRRLG